MLTELLTRLGKSGDAYLLVAVFVTLSIWLITKIIKITDRYNEYVRDTSREDAKTIEKLVVLVEQFTTVSRDTQRTTQEIKQLLQRVVK